MEIEELGKNIHRLLGIVHQLHAENNTLRAENDALKGEIERLVMRRQEYEMSSASAIREDIPECKGRILPFDDKPPICSGSSGSNGSRVSNGSSGSKKTSL
jgi:hypothetical protein